MVLAGGNGRRLQAFTREVLGTERPKQFCRIITPLRSVAGSLGTPAEAAALVHAYRHLPSTNLSEALLARHPEALLVLAARGISWCDWGDPERIIRSLRRFDRQPAWLPVYARTQAAMGPA